MSDTEKIKLLQQQLRTSLRNLNKERRKLKRYYNLLFTLALSSGVIATFLAGLATASKGKIMLGSGTGGWQLTCGVIAFFSLIATIASSFQQNIWVKDKFWKMEDSYGIIKSLLSEIELEPQHYPAIRRDYQRIIQRHPDLLGNEQLTVNTQQ